MVTMFDVPAHELIKVAAQKLKEKPELAPPNWAKFVKTGAHKERPPQQKDWWYIRAASTLRTIYKNGPIGVSKLRTRYGGKRNRGRKPEKFRKGSGAIIRKILQQLEAAKLITKNGKKGRIATPAGKAFLDKIAAELK